MGRPRLGKFAAGTLGRVFGGHRQSLAESAEPDQPSSRTGDRSPSTEQLDISPNDPIVPFFQSASGPVDIGSLDLDSPALDSLRAAGIKLVVPLVTQGELIGLLNLGPRLSEREYSGDDRQLLATLAGYAAPAVRVGQLVREQEEQVRARERIDQELHVAQLIQMQLLPKELPNLDSWHIAAYYKPARAVGGDFYDFIQLPAGQVGIVVGDVTDKGVPAALVMATVHSIMRAAAPRLVSPGEVLKLVNDQLYPEIPANMFATCLYAVLDPVSGRLRYANAGHNVPYVHTSEGVTELRATGMPLGLMPAMAYEEKETILQPGQEMLLHSDGLAEAHAPDGDMFGFPRLSSLVGGQARGEALIDVLLSELDQFTGDGWEQEDDITLVTVARASVARTDGTDAQVLDEFSLPSIPGSEREAMDRVAAAVAGVGMTNPQLDRLRTSVAEAIMNAIEHGNHNVPELPVTVRVIATKQAVTVEVVDCGGEAPITAIDPPDLEAKLAGRQTPRGWGLFLIKNMVDEMTVSSDGEHHTMRLVVNLVGDSQRGGHDAAI
jgi:serine phosphatase RsbU (regulator of sigma subunit)/anti-sigma regulatory factor (Ser/Thr protein kinase)